ncbi:hypothetical protein GRAN_2066 [Granulicella sibirica]|uniref:Uncharacterized protein n=2 Tax=Granulicella sibirica TaxID=2479048 RepID=A0A4Q0TAF4_9BACT|nr:hypothetical protein GRAN_2066 [Granulicella sibirica]
MQLAAAATSVSGHGLGAATRFSGYVAIEADPSDERTRTPGVAWAIEQLRASLKERGMPTQGNGEPSIRIRVASFSSSTVGQFSLPQGRSPEMLAIIPGGKGSRSLLVSGTDARGLVYGLLEVADRVRSSDDVLAALTLHEPLVETTPNRVRSVARAFCSEVEDKPWFYDRVFWGRYLDSLAFARFNRFNFTLGIGYDFPRGVTGDYLHFPYPYLLRMAAYPDVRVDPPLAPGEREKNLEMLQFIAAETERRGLDFQLGVWTHAYEWTDSPNSDHHILGLTPVTHAAYCRDALSELLKRCPQIRGVTLRVHGESGIPEGSYDFWQTVFEAFPRAGRPIEIDMHAKGLDDRMIEIGHGTGMRLTAGAKFWAEHLGIGYHQADIRATEYPRQNVTGTFAVSNGARNFTRYGYGDFYNEKSSVELLYRVWPGTQKHLLWGDPALASGYGRAANFCGAAGMELCEPLFFKGREGSGHSEGRDAYLSRQLGPARLDTDKFDVTYFAWGRYLYNPDTPPDAYRRLLKRTYGDSGEHIEIALANSSRILPLVTTAWLPSASNHSLWVEMYSPISVLPVKGKPLYSDSPVPHNVSSVSPLDPQLFLTIDGYAQALVSKRATAKYNPLEVARWIDEMVAQSTTALAKARKTTAGRMASPAFRRAEEDILILNGLGRYFAALFRTASCYSLFEMTGDTKASAKAMEFYRIALTSWKEFSAVSKPVYMSDVSYGSVAERRGHWADRLPAIETDVASLEQYFAAATVAKTGLDGAALLDVSKKRWTPTLSHTAPQTFHPGSDLELSAKADQPVLEATLWYRHVTHAERWLSVSMERNDRTFTASIPATYTQSPFPLQYYFELRSENDATLYPALNATLSNQPYFAVYKRT